MTEPAKPIQIALISNEPTPYRIHVLRRLADELPGVRVHNIFTHRIKDASVPWQIELDPKLNPVFFANHHLVPGKPISFRAVSLYCDIRNYIQAHNIRLIVLLGYNDLTRLLLIRWGRKAGIPILLNGDSNIFADDRTSTTVRTIKRPVVRWVLRHIAGLMPMGSCGRAFFKRYLDHNLPEFLFPYEPDYAAVRQFDPGALLQFCQTHGLVPDRKRMLFGARLIRAKRADILIRAFARIASTRPDWDLVIAGDGPLRKSLEGMVPADLRGRIKWIGFQQFDRMILAYHTCQVFVLPSEFEPWGVVINEALACGLPIVTTAVVGAAAELVRHESNGLIVPPGDVDAMAIALAQITEGRRYVQMGSQSAPVLESWRRIADPVDGIRKALQHFGLTR